MFVLFQAAAAHSAPEVASAGVAGNAKIHSHAERSRHWRDYLQPSIANACCRYGGAHHRDGPHIGD
jgi:hypothetical protein